MTHFFERHADKIMGTISCFDRVIIQGTLPDICHPGATTGFFDAHRIRISDFKQWAAPMRDEVNESIKAIAAENKIDIEFIRKNNFRKDDRVKEIVARRGDHPGIVHIFSTMESCTAFKPWHNFLATASRNRCNRFSGNLSANRPSTPRTLSSMAARAWPRFTRSWFARFRTRSNPTTSPCSWVNASTRAREGELGGQFSTRIEGHCVRHYMGPSGVKMYDKFGHILQIEIFSNDISFVGAGYGQLK